MAENVSREQIRQASNFFVHFRLTFQVDIYYYNNFQLLAVQILFEDIRYHLP